MSRFSRWLPSRRWLILPPIILGISALVAFALSKKELPRLDPDDIAVAIPLQVVKIERLYLQPKATGYGTAQPSRVWTAISEVKGNIIQTHPELDSGTSVGAGEVLVKIDESDYQLILSQRQADLDAAIAQRQELEASQTADEKSLAIETELLQVSRDELDRVQKLRNQATSQSEIDQARGNLLRQAQSVQKLKNSLSLYPARIASAKASVLMAESRRQEVRRDLGRTTITSPFAGVLAEVNLEPGQFVGQGQSLFQIQDARLLEIEAQFSLQQLDNLAPSLTLRQSGEAVLPDSLLLKKLSAEVVVRSGNFESRWTGVPIRIADSINQQTRTLGVVIQVDNQQIKSAGRKTVLADDDAGQLSTDATRRDVSDMESGDSLATPLRPGTYCEVTLWGPPLANTITVPRTALDGEEVYVVDSDNRLQRRAVKLGFAMGDRVTIASGLEPDERVAIKPPVPAIAGMLVDPIDLTPVDSNQSDAVSHRVLD